MNDAQPQQALIETLETLDEPTRRRVAKQLGASLLASMGFGALGGCGGGGSDSAAVAASSDTPIISTGGVRAAGDTGPILGTTVRVLTIDGGGVRGAIPAAILAQLEIDMGRPCYQIFDVIGGTSTGGLISAGLSCALPTAGVDYAAPYTADTISGFYQNPEVVARLFSPTTSSLPGVYSATYSGPSIDTWLQQTYPSYRLADARAAMTTLPGSTLDFMYTTAYTIGAQSDADIGLYLFDWDQAGKRVQDNYAVWEAVRSTSAAPTYFPVSRVGGGPAPYSTDTLPKWCCDGGVAANDPSLLSLYFVQQKMAAYAARASQVSKIQIISLGTGSAIDNLNVHINGDWGAFNWLGVTNDRQGRAVRAPLLNVLMSAASSTTAATMNTLIALSQFSGPKIEYFRLQPNLPAELREMDKILNAPGLKTLALDYIGKNGSGRAAYSEIVYALRRA
jgi:uncharacterized protein